MNELTSMDKKLLQLLQEGLPLKSRPFKHVAQKLGITEEEVIYRTEDLKKRRIIRRLGGVWDSNQMGFTSLLVALQVEPSKLEQVASLINEYPEVTHNYQRNHTFNLWFTLTAKTRAEIDQILQKISSLEGVVRLLELPAIKNFKTQVNFTWEDENNADPTTERNN